MQNASKYLLAALAICIAASGTAVAVEVVPLPDGVAYLDWRDNAEPDIQDYFVFRARVGIGDWGIVATVQESNCNDALPPGYGEYQWKLRVMDTSGNISNDSLESPWVGVNCSQEPEPVTNITTTVN